MSRKSKSLSEQVESERVITEITGPEKPTKSKTKTKSYYIDLRIHSPASLGYLGIEGIDTAPALVRLAKVKGLDIIAVTDFYSGEFVDRLVTAAQESELAIIPGSMIRCRVGTCDDVNLLCLFEEGFSTQDIREFLLSLNVPESSFGRKKHLVNAEFDDILDKVEGLGGFVLPSRMDKTPHRISALPILVEQYGFRAFDLAYADSARIFRARWPKIKFDLFSFSNANALAQVGSRVAKVKISSPNFAGIRELMQRIEPVGIGSVKTNSAKSAQSPT